MCTVESKKLAGKVGAIGVLAKIMKTYMNKFKVCLNACGAISSVAMTCNIISLVMCVCVCAYVFCLTSWYCLLFAYLITFLFILVEGSVLSAKAHAVELTLEALPLYGTSREFRIMALLVFGTTSFEASNQANLLLLSFLMIMLCACLS